MQSRTVRKSLPAVAMAVRARGLMDVAALGMPSAGASRIGRSPAGSPVRWMFQNALRLLTPLGTRGRVTSMLGFHVMTRAILMLRRCAKTGRSARDTELLYSIDAQKRDWTVEEFYARGPVLVAECVDPVLEALGVDPGGRRVLEIGCGIGRLFAGLAERFGEVWGLDISLAMIEQGRVLPGRGDVARRGRRVAAWHRQRCGRSRPLVRGFRPHPPAGHDPFLPERVVAGVTARRNVPVPVAPTQ